MRTYKFETIVMYSKREDVMLYNTVSAAAKRHGVAPLTILKALYRINRSGHQPDMFTAADGVVVKVNPIKIPRDPPTFAFPPAHSYPQPTSYTQYATTRHNQSRTVAKKVITVKHHGGQWYRAAGMPAALRLIIDLSDGALDNLTPNATAFNHPFHEQVCSLNDSMRSSRELVFQVSAKHTFTLKQES